MRRDVSAFESALRIEAAGVRELLPFLEQQADHGRVVVTDTGNLSRELQETYGDVFVNCQGRLWAVEFKVEADDCHGNFFLETWSNREHFTLGWMYKLRADILLYYFLRQRMLYSIPCLKLKRWAFGTGSENGRIDQFPEKPQKKYDQLNDTWGRCVPIDVIEREVGCRCYTLPLVTS